MEYTAQLSIDTTQNATVVRPNEQYNLPCATDDGEIVIAVQAQRIMAIMPKDIFGTDAPSLILIDTFNKKYLDSIESFKIRFQNNPRKSEYIEMLECKLSKRLQKFKNVYETYWKKIKENYMIEICKNINTDEKLKQIYVQRDCEQLTNYCKQLMANAIEHLAITEFEIPFKVPELTTILTELNVKMQKCKESFQVYTQQIQSYTDKFKEHLTQHIDDIEIDSFIDDQTKLWAITERDAQELLTKYCNKKFKKYNETYVSESVIAEYQNTIHKIFDTMWTSQFSEIKKQKNIEYFEYLLKQEEMPRECIALRKTKKPQHDELINCGEDYYILRTDFEYIKNIVQLCDIDVFYVGKIYQHANKTDTDENVGNITDMANIYRAAKTIGLCYGIYKKENVENMIYSDKQKSEIFNAVNIDGNDHKIYVFLPKDLKVFSKYVSILKSIENKSIIEENYDITLNSII